MESLSPNIFVRDMDKTIEFYKQLGFSVTMSVPDTGSEFVWVMMNNGSVTFMFQTFESLANDLTQISRNDGSSMLLYISLKNIHGF